ncbi:MAG: rna-binding [Lasallia pustulata]|uniref:Rna-binding n=1 Tax=Lasallia pustulata TaxID=136370 RepID=A0A5M8PG54_9LECA|nr:MAG: rna-binding [Lasallia pustulata]
MWPVFGRCVNLQISRELKQYHDVEALEDVRVIRDRQTKVSRGFGFLRFATLEKSKTFVERNYPTIYLYGNESADGDEQAAKVRIAFSRERDDKSRAERQEGEWTCIICNFLNFHGRLKCFRCQKPHIDIAALVPAKPSEFLNSGDSDASPDVAPSQFLLLRGLEPTVTEELLAKGVAKMYKPSGGSSPPTATASRKGGAKVASTTGDANLGAKDGSIRRVLLVRDRRNDESWRYGFAEFATVDDAQAALIRYNSFEKFTISSKPVTASYIHTGVFVPVFQIAPGTEKFTFSPLNNAATKLAYWDQEAYVSELVVSTAESGKVAGTAENQARSASDKAAAAAEKEGLIKDPKETEAKAKKRKAEASTAAKQKKTAPAHLQFWSNRHAELHGIQPTEQPADSNSDADQPTNLTSTQDTHTPPTQSFADPQKNCCYLCSRQFKSPAEVHKHERLSDLHRSNLLNPTLQSKALAKMSKAGLPTTSTSPSAQEDTAEYRDRAKERRAAFGASKKVSLPLKKDRVSEPQSTPADDANDEPAVPLPSKGASLLGKMGWSAGEGLGATGSGRTAPIAPEMYVQGVGLGAQGGRWGMRLRRRRGRRGGVWGVFGTDEGGGQGAV